AETFAQGFDCVILENHGVVTGGRDLQEAFRRFETLEFTAKTLIKAGLSGGTVRFLGDEEIDLERQRDGDLDEFTHSAPSSHENEVRRRLGEFVRRAYRQRLFISTQGSYSARVDAHGFVITPYQADRGIVDAPDLVLVQDGRPEAGKAPSRAAVIHDAIYRMHPEIGAIIN